MVYGVCYPKERPQGAFLKSGCSEQELTQRASAQVGERTELEYDLISESSTEVIIRYLFLTHHEEFSAGDPEVRNIFQITGWLQN